MTNNDKICLALLLAFAAIIALSVLTNCVSVKVQGDPFSGCDTIYQQSDDTMVFIING